MRLLDRSRFRGLISIVFLVVVASTSALYAQDAGPPNDAGDDAETPVADPKVQSIRALLDGSLDVAVDPQTLFDVDLKDDAAVELEAVRLRAMLHASDEAIHPPPLPKNRVSVPPGASSGAHDAGIHDAGVHDAAAPEAGTLLAEIEALTPAIWSTRMELDRARLAFYALTKTRRAAILQDHVARQEAAKPRETEAERQAREAEAERERVLEAARVARTEAERLVGEELARLITIETKVATYRADFRTEQTHLSARRDAVLGWQRRARDVKVAGDVDATYDALRQALRTSRDDLDLALEELNGSVSVLPKTLGPDALLRVPNDIPTEHVRERRATLEKALVQGRKEEQALREQRAASLMDETSTLNQERLGLLPYLSAEKRAAITGFTSAGWDQARSEARHLSLIVRQHRHVGTSWISSLRSGNLHGISPWTVVAVFVPWLLAAILFAWSRRQMPILLALAEKRLIESDRAERRTSPSTNRRLVRFLSQIHVPLEWLLFLFGSIFLLPPTARDILEVQLFASIVGWVVGGALIVDVINALAAGTATQASHQGDHVAAIRLRSLRLVGRTVVAFGLVLMLSSRLVGEGTIYSWVASTYWLAAVPVFLLVIRWWRSTVFDRIERTRKKSALQRWVLANRAGWKSFLAATLGAIQLFVTGIIKTTRVWLSGFDLARRIHAYLYRRELDRLGEKTDQLPLQALPPEALNRLHPECIADVWLENPADDVRNSIRHRAEAPGGGVVAVVGPRGMGKSTLLRELWSNMNALAITCDASTTVDHIRARCDITEGLNLVLIDDAHVLIKPVIGGLAAFDRLITLARAQSAKVTWVFTIDASVWPFLHRARDARPLFDETFILEPWTEAQIGSLLANRSESAKVNPHYDHLLEKRSVVTDEQDLAEALEDKQEGYVRMLWDHARGNPALALEVWRSSLGIDETGVVYVRPLQVPDTTLLDRLPDSSLFVLRAVLQLAPAAPEDVARATRLSLDQVLNAVQFGCTQGILKEQAGRIRVSWSWRRAVTRILERRHLLVMP